MEIPFWLSIVIISFIENERKLETIVFFEWCHERKNYEDEQRKDIPIFKSKHEI